MENKILEIINSLLIKREQKPIEKLESKLSLREDLGFDSLDLAELTVKIEDEFGIDIFESGIIDKISEIEAKLKV